MGVKQKATFLDISDKFVIYWAVSTLFGRCVCYMNGTYYNYTTLNPPKNSNVWKEELNKISDVFLRMITIKGSFHLQVIT